MKALSAIALALILLSACISPPSRWFEPENVMQLAFGEGCVPVVVDRADLNEITTNGRFKKSEHPEGAPPQASPHWNVLFGGSMLVRSADDCQASISRGNPSDLRQQALNILTQRGISMTRIKQSEMPDGRKATIYCTKAPRPLWLQTFEGEQDTNGFAITLILKRSPIDDPPVCQTEINN